MMKVLMINGSPNENGCTFRALTEVASALKEEGVDSQILSIGKGAIHGCIGCGACSKLGHCVFTDDKVCEAVELAKEADGLIVGSPVYYASPNGSILSFLDRMFYSGSAYLAYKPAAAVASARRAGTTATLDALNKYFMITRCRWYLPTTGTWFTERPLPMWSRIWKACRSCGALAGTWPGC